MRAGDTFRLQGVADKHTWVIVSDPDQDAAHVYCVAFTSHNVSKDPTCLIRPDEYPLLTHLTCIDYFDVKILSAAALDGGISKGLIQKRTPVPPELLRRIRDGFNTTRDARFEHIAFLIAQGGI